MRTNPVSISIPALLLLASPAFAGSFLVNGTAMPGTVQIGQEVTVDFPVKYANNETIACGVRVNFGDGSLPKLDAVQKSAYPASYSVKHAYTNSSQSQPGGKFVVTLTPDAHDGLAPCLGNTTAQITVASPINQVMPAGLTASQTTTSVLPQTNKETIEIHPPPKPNIPKLKKVTLVRVTNGAPRPNPDMFIVGDEIRVDVDFDSPGKCSYHVGLFPKSGGAAIKESDQDTPMIVGVGKPSAHGDYVVRAHGKAGAADACGGGVSNKVEEAFTLQTPISWVDDLNIAVSTYLFVANGGSFYSLVNVGVQPVIKGEMPCAFEITKTTNGDTKSFPLIYTPAKGFPMTATQLLKTGGSIPEPLFTQLQSSSVDPTNAQWLSKAYNRHVSVTIKPLGIPGGCGGSAITKTLQIPEPKPKLDFTEVVTK